MIEIINLEKTFTVNPILRGITTTIKDGEIIAIIGGSGCGKSTLIRCINMLGKPSSGKIILDDEEITAPGYDLSKISKKIGMVFQSFNLFNHLTVIENIMLPQIQTLKRSKQEAYDKAIALLKQVNLSTKVFSYPDSLSGGQKQRVAIARTLAMDPEVILFDEPTSALDPTMVGEVKAVINSLTKTGKTMIIVTHDMDFAKSIATRVFFMADGIIYEEGSPEEIFNNPKKEKTKQFINKSKVLELDIQDQNFDFYGANTTIEEYCHKNHIPYTKAYHLQSIFEELNKEILLPKMKEVKINYLIEYSQNNDELVATVKYGTEKFDINSTDNELSLSIIKGFTNSIEYNELKEDYANKVILNIK